MRATDLKILVLSSNGIIIFFYSFYLFKWEPTIVGVFRELLILPAFLVQFFLALYILVRLITKKMKLSILNVSHLILTLLLILSFQL